MSVALELWNSSVTGSNRFLREPELLGLAMSGSLIQEILLNVQREFILSHNKTDDAMLDS
jgi:hypothetical protein